MRSVCGCCLILTLIGGLTLSGASLEAVTPEPARLGFPEIYASVGVLGLKFSEKVLRLSGSPVVMRGFMAPPLKPEADFFVMTKEPVSLCPFCQSDADWPADIVVVYLARDAAFTSNTNRIEVTGTLEVGSRTDPKTGFVSLLRLVQARLRRV